MRTKYIIGVTVGLCASNMLGTNGVKALESSGPIDSVSVTSTNMTVKFRSLPARNFGVRFLRTQEYRKLESNEELVLTPDQEVRFGSNDGRIVLKPVSFKGQRKGFRVVNMPVGSSAYDVDPTSVITYIVLSDTPMELGEDEVEMVMDNGEWVKVEDSNSLIIEKLGWYAELLLMNPEETMQDAEKMAKTLNDPFVSKIWNALVEHGLIKTNAVGKQDEAAAPSHAKEAHAGQGGAVLPPSRKDNATPATVVEVEQSKRNNLWLYGGILLCILFPILYFLRRKLKT